MDNSRNKKVTPSLIEKKKKKHKENKRYFAWKVERPNLATVTADRWKTIQLTLTLLLKLNISYQVFYFSTLCIETIQYLQEMSGGKIWAI